MWGSGWQILRQEHLQRDWTDVLDVLQVPL